MGKNAVLHKKSAILSLVSRRMSDLCVLSWIAKNIVRAWHHECVGVLGVCGGVCVCVFWYNRKGKQWFSSFEEEISCKKEEKTFDNKLNFRI